MNIGDLFDSPLKILIIAVVALVIFGSTKLPVFARSLGRSMRILKSEMSSLHDDDEHQETVGQAQPQPQAAIASPHEQQIEQLQQQVRDLQQQAAGKGATAAEAHPTNQPG